MIQKCDCVLCTASRIANALQVSKPETRTIPAEEFARYTRFELEEFAREQAGLVAKYQKFVLNQRAVIASMEKEIEQRDREMNKLSERLDVLAGQFEHLAEVAQLAQESRGLNLRSITLDAIEENRASTSTRCGAALAQVSQAVSGK